ncbi:hypothetical protein ANN_11587 [Periplaneta americana]|uniref:Uncharacterized protein n=1 Tax=Periplaneta americana TaxID=6978 RepID=A0ABQ8T5F7_PERAM|nr:hypothetical protein ANN_11587 [Periplaneta americana]
MASLCEGGNEPSGSLKAVRIPNLTVPVDNNDVTLQRNRNKTAGRFDGYQRIPNLTGPVASMTSRCNEIRNKTAGRIDDVMATV